MPQQSTAPTAGGFQGFEIFNITKEETKEKLVTAANNQPYVNAPLVIVFCSNPNRIKMKFSNDILQKFSLQDATLAAGYAQDGSPCLGIKPIWIGMFDEKSVKGIINTISNLHQYCALDTPKKCCYQNQREN